MFELEKSFRFEAGHVLPPPGKCSVPHGHSYQMIVMIRSETLIVQGTKKNMVMDFHDISTIVKPMIEEFLDHKWLNDSLNCEAPTAEFIAKWIFDYLDDLLPNLYAISLYETPTSKVTYRRLE